MISWSELGVTGGQLQYHAWGGGGGGGGGTRLLTAKQVGCFNHAQICGYPGCRQTGETCSVYERFALVLNNFQIIAFVWGLKSFPCTIYV